MFTLDTHFLSIHEPTSAVYVIDVIACHQATYAISEPVNNALLPGLHRGPIKGDRFGMNAHCSEILRTSLLVSFARRKQGFKWDASLMETCTTRQALVDQGYMSSKLCSADRRNVAAWACAEHKYVYCRCNISNYHTISSFYLNHI